MPKPGESPTYGFNLEDLDELPVRDEDRHGFALLLDDIPNCSQHILILPCVRRRIGKGALSSGKTIQSFTHISGLAISEGRVYVVTWDNTVYAFGLGQ